MAPGAVERRGVSMSVYQSFSYSPTDLAEQLTGASHDTLAWMYKNEYITQEEYDTLLGRLVVMAVPNKKGYGRRLLEKMFGSDASENAWVFPIVEVADHYAPATPSKPKNVTKLKPKLEVVKDDTTV
jgi:hypothetical protein